jgi:hypothetical protein
LFCFQVLNNILNVSLTTGKRKCEAPPPFTIAYHMPQNGIADINPKIALLSNKNDCREGEVKN